MSSGSIDLEFEKKATRDGHIVNIVDATTKERKHRSLVRKDAVLSVDGSSCSYCSRIVRYMQGYEERPDVISWGETIETSPSCWFCRSLKEGLQLVFSECHKNLPPAENDFQTSFGMSSYSSGALFVDFIGSQMFCKDGWFTLDQAPQPFHSPPQTCLDPSTIQNWMRVCENTHGLSCTHCFTEPPLSPILIDVKNAKLVQASSEARYIALSYVWGGVTTFQTTKENYSDLQEDGALIATFRQLPAVIKDAISLVKALGERFLWVDSLCVVQNDPTIKHDQIRQMDRVYNRAILTIISLNGNNAQCRLPGIAPGTRPLRDWYKSSQNGQTLRFQGGALDDLLGGTPYETRSWTYQERLLSRRCLFLSSHRMYFSCGEAIYNDFDDSKDSLENSVSGFRRMAIVGFTTWEEYYKVYAELINEYVGRDLSFPSDTLNAFQGIMNIFSKASGTRFLSGLPSAFIDVGLLWLPFSAICHLRNRIPASDLQFPSWCWSGWSCPVDMACERRRSHINHGYPFSSDVFRSEIGGLSPLMVEEAGILLEVQRDPDISKYVEPVEGLEKRSRAMFPTKPVVGPCILHFFAFTLPTTAFESDYVYFSPPPIFLKQRSGHSTRQIGQFLHLWDDSSMDDLEFVLLSRITRVDHMRDFSLDPYHPKPWSVKNVMLIRWKDDGSWAERIALAQLDSEVWDSLGPVPKYIRLG
ncbi:HET-domain-containing protein [Aulographum hederae CBS 113979]|uniref:HET-domain-containing protein n=1 Tax=Aulographum hederae CBS 113979 TaxID=1176131 RepID=A0A6G1H1G1_9PEZI|nr:HET-domain-containing protein [Aulographum hederae CBS 113979]